jgi:hypothetical protein
MRAILKWLGREDEENNVHRKLVKIIGFFRWQNWRGHWGFSEEFWLQGVFAESEWYSLSNLIEF